MAGGLVRLRIDARGAVQGVGFRPFVFGLARGLGLAGYVLNSPQGAVAEVEGPAEAVAAFVDHLRSELPPPAFLTGLETAYRPATGEAGFEIRESLLTGGRSALVLPDIATCPRCLAEVFDPANRRYRYPFTNCTHCGPRYSIIRALPYDRPATAMAGFAMCPSCLREYREPDDRRFHAQPNACPECGPQLALWDRFGTELASRDEALLQACAAIREGEIVAVKGIGGFHLMVDAGNEDAVRRLRQRKRREAKPLAVLVTDLAMAQTVAEVDAEEARLLTGPEAPIVLLRSRGGLAAGIAPENPNVGVMLPYSPLHHLVMRELGFPVVATSGNLSDEPICTDEGEAVERFRDIADRLLVHDRPIVRPIDDSVARVMAGRPMLMRRARGYAPLPFAVPEAEGGLLAVGAHLKSSVALALPGSVVVGQHIGDLDTASARRRLEDESRDLSDLHATPIVRVAHDLHPDYASTAFAESLGVERVGVQHHLAHAAACLAENGVEGPALAVVWDGTGYGPDGTIWGGEFFLVDGREARRRAHFRPFSLPGGEAAVREGRRAALGLLRAMGLDPEAAPEWLEGAFEGPMRRQVRALPDGPATTSAGRLFDAAASLAAGIHRSRFEGDAAMRFEGLAVDSEAYPIRYADGVVDWEPTVKAVLGDRGTPAADRSGRFHAAMVEAIVLVAREAGVASVALSGGCFQNRRLFEGAWRRLTEEGFVPVGHQRIPPNDGGIAFGQAIVASRRIRLASDGLRHLS